MFRLGRRVLDRLLLLLGISLASFVLLSVSRGKPLDDARLNPQISANTVAAIEKEYDLDRPLAVRYFRWIVSVVRGEFGYSALYHQSVGSLILPRAYNTLLLTVLAAVVTWAIALPLGTIEALCPGSWFDRVNGLFAAILLAIPDILLGLFLLLFAARTKWFPAGGMTSITTGTTTHLTNIHDVARHLFLPVVGLVLGAQPILIRHVRSSMVESLKAPFVQSARALGIPRWRIVCRHALPAAMNSLISLFGFTIGGLLSASVLIEIILSWPGLGPLVLEAVLARDTYVVMSALMISSVLLVAGNLVSDALLYWNDPRIRE